MIKSSVIDILKTFSEEEITGFGEFIEAAFHNKNRKIIQLFSLLKKFHPHYIDKSLTKENLFRKIAGNVKYKDTYMRNLLSDLNFLAEKFLQYTLITNKSTYARLLIEELNKRDLYELTAKKVTSLEKQIELNKSKDQEYYLNKNFIHEMKSFSIVDKTLTDSFRKEQISDIIKQFIISLMENSFYLLLEEQRVNIRHSFVFLRYILEYVKKNISEFDESPLLRIYYYLWLCFLQSDDDKYFIEAKSNFRKYFSVLTKIDKKNIYSVMQIYYINKIDKGDNSYNKEFLNFLLEMTKFNILSHRSSNFINLNLYRNILILSTMEKEVSILKNFIADFINLVSEESRESIKEYSDAHLFFLQGKFEKSLELCSKINYSDFLITTNDNLYFKNDIKSLMLKCLYELGSYESALTLLDTYKHFLKNSKQLKDAQKEKFFNFLYFTYELIKLKMNFDEFNFKKLRIKFEKDKSSIYESWIREKIEDLKKENKL